MRTIEIDDDIFEFIKSNAEPFVDHSPNAVLRRLLLAGDLQARPAGEAQGEDERRGSDSSESVAFVKEILGHDFSDSFERYGRFRMMFESASELVYFQNFNQASERWWFRITKRPWDTLRNTEKRALIYLTNPAMRLAYALAVEDVEARVRAAGWNRDTLEVNIDHARHRWTELDWKIENRLKRY